MTKTLRQAIFLRLILFFILGIIVQTEKDLFPEWIYIAVFSLILIGISFIPPVVYSYRWRWLFGLGLLLLCCSSAGILTYESWKASEWTGGGEVETYRVQVIDEPVKKPRTLMCKVKINNRKALVYIPADSAALTLIPSDWLLIQAQFEKADRMNFRKQKIAAIAFIRKNNWEKIENPATKQGFNLRFQALKYRRILLNHLKKVVPEEQSYAVASAILFGNTYEIDQALWQTFAATGSSHLLSVSGLHFSIIYGILYFMFSFLGKGKNGTIIRQMIIIPLMWVFVFLTGMGPSVIRAAIMLSLWGIGNAFPIRAFTMNTMGVAAFFMLLYNPLNLYNIGFQLSFSAVFSILWINKYLVQLCEFRNPIFKYTWELSCISTSAQLGTVPLSIYYFHQFPLIYLVTNLFAVPLTGILLGLIPLSMILHFLFGEYAWMLAPVNKGLSLLISGLGTLKEIPNGLIENISFTQMDAVCAALYIVFGFLLLVKKRIIWLYLLILLAVFQTLY